MSDTELSLQAAARKKMEATPGMMGGVQPHKKKPKTVEDFYAQTGVAPILAGFKKKNKGPNAGMSRMKSIEDPDAVWAEVAARADSAERRALYIHIPFCLARCKFCSFYHSRTNEAAIVAYVNDLVKELELVSDSTYATSRPFNAVYFGGGTPTDMAPAEFRRILSHLQANWNLANDCEITIEGRLHGFSDEKVEVCLEHGVNRFSFGVQSFDTRIRRSMGRIETQEAVMSRLDELVRLNVANVSIDLIYGFPDQTDEIWTNDLQMAADSGIDSVSVYRLKMLPGSPILDQTDKNVLSPPATIEKQAEQFAISNELYRSLHARRVGVSHWAFTNRERCIYNSLSAYGGSCLPVGCGAGGSLGAYRVMQQMSLEQYAEKVAQGRKPLGMVSRGGGHPVTGILSGELALNLGINLNGLSRRTGESSLNELFAPLLTQWHEAGIVFYDAATGLLKLTDAGVFRAPSLQQNLMEFYAWRKGEVS